MQMLLWVLLCWQKLGLPLLLLLLLLLLLWVS
jgi:hypothetical protein